MTGKPPIIVVSADWCGHCSNPDFRKSMQTVKNIVPNYVEIESKQLRQFPQEFQNRIDGFPTVGMMGKNGQFSAFPGDPKNPMEVIQFYNQQVGRANNNVKNNANVKNNNSVKNNANNNNTRANKNNVGANVVNKGVNIGNGLRNNNRNRNRNGSNVNVAVNNRNRNGSNVNVATNNTRYRNNNTRNAYGSNVATNNRYNNRNAYGSNVATNNNRYNRNRYLYETPDVERRNRYEKSIL